MTKPSHTCNLLSEHEVQLQFQAIVESSPQPILSYWQSSKPHTGWIFPQSFTLSSHSLTIPLSTFHSPFPMNILNKTQLGYCSLYWLAYIYIYIRVLHIAHTRAVTQICTNIAFQCSYKILYTKPLVPNVIHCKIKGDLTFLTSSFFSRNITFHKFKNSQLTAKPISLKESLFNQSINIQCCAQHWTACYGLKDSINPCRITDSILEIRCFILSRIHFPFGLSFGKQTFLHLSVHLFWVELNPPSVQEQTVIQDQPIIASQS